jgi:peptidoglycan hydrolase CwlO-like protein
LFLTTSLPTHAELSTSDLETQIAEYQAKLTELAGQKQTLAQALSVLTTQIKLTETKIIATSQELKTLELEIGDLSGKITSLNYSLDDLTTLFVARVRATYKASSPFPVLMVAEASGIQGLVQNLEYAKKVRDHDRALLIALEKSRLDYDAQKTQKEVKQKEIASLKAKLDRDKAALAGQVAAKNKLLADTKNDEARYQKLLGDAQRQLASFRRFVSTQGGASILSSQTKCDGWGCYYNQRDGDWGNKSIGYSGELMREVGCLVTSMAMVASHYGKSLKPGDIADSGNPFWSNTAYMNQGTWTVNGVTMTRTRIGSSLAKIDEELAAGRPVIVGIYGGPDHFLVIKAKEGSDYIMHDPFPEHGSDLKFTSKYPLSAISTVDRVTVQ